MITINAIELAAGISCDVNEEINELDAMIKEGAKASEIQKKYNHISSLLVGMAYVVDYTEEDEDRHSLNRVLDDLRGMLNAYRRQCMEIIYTARCCGRKVTIEHDFGKYTLALAESNVASAQIYRDLDDLDAVKAKFDSLCA